MLKINVFKEDEKYVKVERKPYFILLSDQEYEKLKDESPEFISAYFYINEVVEGKKGRMLYQEIGELKNEKKLDLKDYVVVKWRIGTSLVPVYIPEDYYSGSEK